MRRRSMVWCGTFVFRLIILNSGERMQSDQSASVLFDFNSLMRIFQASRPSMAARLHQKKLVEEEKEGEARLAKIWEYIKLNGKKVVKRLQMYQNPLKNAPEELKKRLPETYTSIK